MVAKIPKSAKRVFKGVIFDVYHWRQKMFDGTHETFEKLKRPGSVEVIAVVGDKIIVQEQEQPHHGSFYSIPGGRVDHGESSLKAAKRELLEETGLASDDWELFFSYEPYSKIDWRVHCYIARECRKITPMNHESGERIMNKKVSFGRFVGIITDENFRGIRLANKFLRLDKKELSHFKKRLFRSRTTR
jgi:ADP-ribose pyrophosphatase